MIPDFVTDPSFASRLYRHLWWAIYPGEIKYHGSNGRTEADNLLSLTLNYTPFTNRGVYRPQYWPHVSARGIQASHDEVWREDVWLSSGKGGAELGRPSAHPSVPIGGWTPAMDTPGSRPALRDCG